MTESRKHLLAQINQVNTHLELDLAKIEQCKTALRVQHPLLMLALFLAPAFATGWQLGAKKMSMTNRLVELGLVAASGQFKNQLRNML